MTRYDDDTARWGVPTEPITISDRAREYLHRVVGMSAPQSATPRPGVIAAPTRLDGQVVADLERAVPHGVSTDDDDRLAHGAGFSYLDLVSRRGAHPPVPDVVVHPANEQQVHELLQVAVARQLAVIPFGGGTSVVGGLRPEDGGRAGVVSVALDRMAELVDVDPINSTVTVGPGMTGPTLERLLQARGFTLGHYPQSWERASIGGYAATRSAGQNSAGYGRSNDMIEKLRVVTPTATFALGVAPGSAAGPDLRQVFIGSEGAFGIITEITLRIRRIPAVTRYEGVMFGSYQAGLDAFRELLGRRARADLMRLSDPEETETNLTMALQGRTAQIFDRYLSLRRIGEGGCMAILGYEGTRTQVGARHHEAWKVLRAHGAVQLGQRVGKSWEHGRFSGPYLRDVLMDEGYLVETLETATGWRELPALRQEVTAAIRAELGDSGPGPLVMSHLSHVYETGGSLYVTVAARRDESDPIGQWQRAKAAACDAIVQAGATITHHHAVGRDHQPWLVGDIGEPGLALLRAIKHEVDPDQIMNPGALIADR